MLTTKMPEKWTLTGDWLNSCSCDSGCPCLFHSDPTKGYCDGIDAFHIRKGKYGTVSLDTLNAVVVSHSPGNWWKGNWVAGVYFDERASAEQRKVLETLFTGKAGGALAMIAGLISTVKGVKYTSITINPKERLVHIPGVLDFQLKPTEGGNKKKPIQIANNPLAPAIEPMFMGVGIRSHFKDYDMEFNNTGKDGNWAPFNFRGP